MASSRWGEDIDEELHEQKRKGRIKVGFVFNFVQISRLLKRIEEETSEWDKKYPKSELLKIWACDMLFMTIFFTFSYSILIIVTGLFLFFYGFLLFQIAGVWKRFNYSLPAYWLMTLAGLGATFSLGFLLFRRLIFGG